MSQGMRQGDAPGGLGLCGRTVHRAVLEVAGVAVAGRAKRELSLAVPSAVLERPDEAVACSAPPIPPIWTRHWIVSPQSGFR